VLEHFQTDTADYADILLPATTQLEHLDVVKPYGHYYMVANNPAIAPLGECKPNSEIFCLLAKAMGFTEQCFSDAVETIAQAAMAEDEDFNDVSAWGVGSPRECALPGGFDTPSGKVEFYSARARHSADPLPDYIAPVEDVEARGEPLRWR
jgi:anaerobic selenocysteine-containing dehydrogenase